VSVQYGQSVEERRRLLELAAANGGTLPAGVSMPPPGTYDPALDAQLGQGQRGLQDLLSDYARDYGTGGWGEGRAGADYNIQAGQVGDLSQQQLGDLNLSANRTQDDLNRGLVRGSYDINTGAERGIADLIRSSGYQIDDTNRSADRGIFDVNRSADRSTFDVNRESGRGLEDIRTSRARAGEDYGTATADLSRQYERLGSQQTQGARAAGVSAGGALAQAMRARAENQAHDRAPIDTSYQRFGQDSARDETRTIENRDTSLGRIGEDRSLQVGRIGEDRTTSLGRIGTERDTGVSRYNDDRNVNLGRLTEDTQLNLGRLGEDTSRGAARIGSAADTQLGQLGLTYGRSLADAGTAADRAQREGTQYGLDIGKSALYQAVSSGQYVPPAVQAPQAPAATYKAPAQSVGQSVGGKIGSAQDAAPVSGVSALSPFRRRNGVFGGSSTGSFSSYF
jgi:hypothetical protein